MHVLVSSIVRHLLNFIASTHHRMGHTWNSNSEKEILGTVLTGL